MQPVQSEVYPNRSHRGLWPHWRTAVRLVALPRRFPQVNSSEIHRSALRISRQALRSFGPQVVRLTVILEAYLASPARELQQITIARSSPPRQGARQPIGHRVRRFTDAGSRTSARRDIRVRNCELEVIDAPTRCLSLAGPQKEAQYADRNCESTISLLRQGLRTDCSRNVARTIAGAKIRMSFRCQSQRHLSVV